MDRSIENEASAQNSQTAKTSIEPDLLAEETRRLVMRKARRLVAKAGLPTSELDDVASALTESLVRDFKGFNQHRGSWLPYAERSIQYASKNLLRRVFAGKRDRRKTVSLDVMVKVDSDESTELAQLVTRIGIDKRTGCSARHEVEQSNMRLDLAEFKDSLPLKLRELADALEGETILDISRRTGTPRSTLYDRLELLRRAAEDGDLSKYID